MWAPPIHLNSNVDNLTNANASDLSDSLSSLDLIQVGNICQKSTQLSFEISGISIAESNILRRTLIKHIPIMQISDEVMHMECRSLPKQPVREALIVRLKQIPFQVDATFFSKHALNLGCDTPLDGQRCLKYHLFEEFPHPINPITGKNIEYGIDNIPQKRVLSKSISWIPLSMQQKKELTDFHIDSFTNVSDFDISKLCRPLYEDIILAVLNPGECIDISFYLTAGTKVGQNNVCFSAVRVTSIAQVPDVILQNPVTDIEDATNLIKNCPNQVFELIKQDGLDESNVVRKNLINVANPSDCSKCEQCLTSDYPYSKDIVLKDISNKYHIMIESHGSLPIEKLFSYACEIIQSTCKSMLEQL